MTVYVSIGNSDDKLTQSRWAGFISEVEGQLKGFPFYGAWFSRPDVAWQNACWCIDLTDVPAPAINRLKHALSRIADSYQQDSIAWAEAKTEFITRPADE